MCASGSLVLGARLFAFVVVVGVVGSDFLGCLMNFFAVGVASSASTRDFLRYFDSGEAVSSEGLLENTELESFGVISFAFAEGPVFSTIVSNSGLDSLVLVTNEFS